MKPSQLTNPLALVDEWIIAKAVVGMRISRAYPRMRAEYTLTPDLIVSIANLVEIRLDPRPWYTISEANALIVRAILWPNYIDDKDSLLFNHDIVKRVVPIDEHGIKVRAGRSPVMTRLLEAAVFGSNARYDFK